MKVDVDHLYNLRHRAITRHGGTYHVEWVMTKRDLEELKRQFPPPDWYSVYPVDKPPPDTPPTLFGIPIRIDADAVDIHLEKKEATVKTATPRVGERYRMTPSQALTVTVIEELPSYTGNRHRVRVQDEDGWKYTVRVGDFDWERPPYRFGEHYIDDQGRLFKYTVDGWRPLSHPTPVFPVKRVTIHAD